MYGHDGSRSNTNSNSILGTASVASLAPAWQVNIGSNGDIFSNSTPTVAGGSVYVGSSVSHGPNFFAFDAATGQAKWSTNLGYEFTPECGMAENVGIPSTAAVIGNVVVVGGGDAAYYGLDARTGAILWRHPLGVGPSGFAWASPLTAGGAVFVGASSQCDNPSVRGEVRSLNTTDGTLIADQFFAPPGGSGGGIWNSPALSSDGQTLVVASGEDNGDGYPYEQAVVTLNANTLQILQADKKGPIAQDADFATTPVIFHDQAGRAMTASSLKSGTLYAYFLDSVSNGPAWTRNTGVAIGAMGAYDGAADKLFAIGTIDGAAYTGGNAAVYALDPSNGTDVWPPVLIGNVASNIAIAGGLIFVNTGVALDVLDETTGVSRRTIVPANAGPTVSGVAIASGTVYWVSGAWLNAWNVPGSP